MSEPSAREVLDRIADRLLRTPRSRIANRSDWIALELPDILKEIEKTAQEYGAPARNWDQVIERL